MSLSTRVTMLCTLVTSLTVAVLAWASLPATPTSLATDGGGWTPHESGPVGPSDRALLTVLRQDLLWRIPVSQQAGQMARRPAVRALATAVAADLTELSDRVRAVAGQLAVQLPSQPTAQQQAWSSQLSSTSGGRYDQALLAKLHAGCDQLTPLIAEARAETRNELVRALADQAATVVDRHTKDLTDLINKTSTT